MGTKTDLLIEKLQSLYDRAINSTTKRGFFLTLFEYIETYDEEPQLNLVVKQIVTKGKSDIKKLQDLEKSALKELRQVYKQVKSYIKKKKVKNRAAIDNLAQFTALENKTLTTSQGPVKGRYGYLSYVLMTLTEDTTANHLPFTRKYGKITNEKRIKQWTFSPSYDKWEQEKNWLDRIKLTKAWYSWDKLVLFYTIYRDYEKMQKTNLEKNKLWDAFNLNALFGEIRDILDNKNPEPGYIEFQEGEYKTHLQRVHLFTKQALSSLKKTPQKVKDHTYTLKDNVLTIDGKEVKFKADTRQLTILKLLDKRKKYIYFGEEEKAIEGATGAMGNIKNICYEACRRIEIRLIKEGFKDFIDYNYNRARINPNYKKLQK